MFIMDISHVVFLLCRALKFWLVNDDIILDHPDLVLPYVIVLSYFFVSFFPNDYIYIYIDTHTCAN